MNSVAQVAMGILILGAAFIFGSQLQNQPTASNDPVDTSSNEEFVWQRPDAMDELREKASESSGLIQLPPAKQRIAPTNGPAKVDRPDIAPANHQDAQSNKLNLVDLPEAKRKSDTPERAVMQPLDTNASTVSAKTIIETVNVKPDFSNLEAMLAERYDDSNNPPGQNFEPPFPFENPVRSSSNAAAPKRDTRPSAPVIENGIAHLAEMTSSFPQDMRPQPDDEVSVEIADPSIAHPQLEAPANTIEEQPNPHSRSIVEFRNDSPNPGIVGQPSPMVEPRLARKQPISITPKRDPWTANGYPRQPSRSGLKPVSRLVQLKPRHSGRIHLETNEFVRHVTETGETLRGLSQRYFGKPDYYLDIYLANQDVLESPGQLAVGTSLKIPRYSK